MHGPSSADEQRGCRSRCAGLAYGASLTLAWYASVRTLMLPSMHALVPRLANPSLTDAPNALYTSLPNHALRWLRVSEAAPTSKWIRVYY